MSTSPPSSPSPPPFPYLPLPPLLPPTYSSGMPIVHREILEKAAQEKDLKTLLSLTDHMNHQLHNHANNEDVRYLRSSSHFNPFYLHQQAQQNNMSNPSQPSFHPPPGGGGSHHLPIPRVVTSEPLGHLMSDSVESNGSISLALPAMGAPPYIASPQTSGLVHKPPPLVSNNWIAHHHPRGPGGTLETGILLFLTACGAETLHKHGLYSSSNTPSNTQTNTPLTHPRTYSLNLFCHTAYNTPYLSQPFYPITKCSLRVNESSPTPVFSQRANPCPATDGPIRSLCHRWSYLEDNPPSFMYSPSSLFIYTPSSYTYPLFLRSLLHTPPTLHTYHLCSYPLHVIPLCTPFIPTPIFLRTYFPSDILHCYNPSCMIFPQ